MKFNCIKSQKSRIFVQK